MCYSALPLEMVTDCGGEFQLFSPWRCLLDPSWELQAFTHVCVTIDEATLMI